MDRSFRNFECIDSTEAIQRIVELLEPEPIDTSFLFSQLDWCFAHLSDFNEEFIQYNLSDKQLEILNQLIISEIKSYQDKDAIIKAFSDSYGGSFDIDKGMELVAGATSINGWFELDRSLQNVAMFNFGANSWRISRLIYHAMNLKTGKMPEIISGHESLLIKWFALMRADIDLLFILLNSDDIKTSSGAAYFLINYLRTRICDFFVRGRRYQFESIPWDEWAQERYELTVDVQENLEKIINGIINNSTLDTVKNLAEILELTPILFHNDAAYKFAQSELIPRTINYLSEELRNNDSEQTYKAIFNILTDTSFHRSHYLADLGAETQSIYPAKIMFSDWLDRISNGAAKPLYYFEEIKDHNKYLEAISNMVIDLANRGEATLSSLKQVIETLVSGEDQDVDYDVRLTIAHVIIVSNIILKKLNNPQLASEWSKYIKYLYLSYLLDIKYAISSPSFIEASKIFWKVAVDGDFLEPINLDNLELLDLIGILSSHLSEDLKSKARERLIGDLSISKGFLQQIGFILMSLGEYDLALHFFDQLENMSATNAGPVIITNARGNNIRFSGDMHQITLAIYGKGMVLFKQKKYGDAVEVLDKGFPNMQQNYMPYWNNYGIALLHAGNAPRALEIFDKALEAYPDDIALIENKAATLMALDKGEDALKWLETYERAGLRFDNLDGLRGSAYIVLYQDAIQKACAIFERSTTSNTENPIHNYNYALALFAHGDIRKAYQQCIEAIELDNEYEEAKRLKLELKNCIEQGIEALNLVALPPGNVTETYIKAYSEPCEISIKHVIEFNSQIHSVQDLPPDEYNRLLKFLKNLNEKCSDSSKESCEQCLHTAQGNCLKRLIGQVLGHTGGPHGVNERGDLQATLTTLENQQLSAAFIMKSWGGTAGKEGDTLLRQIEDAALEPGIDLLAVVAPDISERTNHIRPRVLAKVRNQNKKLIWLEKDHLIGLLSSFGY